jgi:methionyl-tRNA formyltransferase
MNIVFFGSSNFAVPSLKALLTSDHKISCVVTQPDREKGRGLHLSGTVIKTVALESDLRIYQPGRINTNETIKFLKDRDADLFIVIAYGQILSEEILRLPKIFAINVHASILPRYRGAAPINWAIINGEKNTGLTVIKMTKKMDAGPIILQKEVAISEEDTSVTLEKRLSKEAGQSLLDSLESIVNNNYSLTPQNENMVSFAPKLKKENGKIDWNKPAGEIYNLIRGCLPWPGAFTYYNSKLLKIYKAKVSSQVLECVSSITGEVINISKEGIIVATGKDNLIIEELQIEGKRIMTAEEFITGHKICIGEIFKKIGCSST